MSETLQEKFGPKIPWIFGNSVRIPRVKYPIYQEGSLSLPSPGRSMMLMLTYVLTFFLVMGGIYILIEEPIPLGGNSDGNAVWLYPSTHDAFIIESLVAAILVFISGIGFFLMYNSTKHSFNYSYAVKLLVLGIFFVALAFGVLQYMIGVKSGRIKL